MKKIFVSVASYRDPELGKTLLSAIEKASNPNNIYFGIVYQGSHKERPSFDFIPNFLPIRVKRNPSLKFN